MTIHTDKRSDFRLIPIRGFLKAGVRATIARLSFRVGRRRRERPVHESEHPLEATYYVPRTRFVFNRAV